MPSRRHVTLEDIERLFRDNAALASSLKRLIERYAREVYERTGRKIKIMNFCGTHEWTTVHYGLRSLMPSTVELVAGPGCPVCITPAYYVDRVIELALDGVKVYTFGDAYKLPTVRPVRGAMSLAEARSLGGKVEVVYSFLDAVKRAEREGGVFFGIGFETTAPSYAVLLDAGAVPKTLSFLSVLRLTPPAAAFAIEAAVERGLEPVQGVIAPGHVSTVTGAKPWAELSKRFHIPVVVSGFEPIDLLISIARILKMLRDGKPGIEIEYTRAVTWEGNVTAQRVVNRVFEVVDAAWRGLGFIPRSGWDLKAGLKCYDAHEQYGIEPLTPEKWKYDLPPGCRCADVTLGIAKPTDCPLFMRTCTPDKPWGPCMVSSEGTCAVWARFGGGGVAEEVARDIGVL